MAGPRPFRIEIAQERLNEIETRIRDAAWPEMPEVADDGDRWAWGADVGYMKELCAYWLDSYDWRTWEARLNEFDHFKAEIDGLDIHFIRENGSGSNPPALLLTHGWPGSVFEFVDVIEPLAHPERFGGDAEDGVTVIAPSLPGYIFSQAPKAPIGPKAIALLWDKLMREALGFDTYIAQGGDWGSSITGRLGYSHGVDKDGGCQAIHLNMFGFRPAKMTPETDEEKQWMQNSAFMFEVEGAYLRLQGTKPVSLAYAMQDSPLGVAAWIIEKFNTWSDTSGEDGARHIENTFTKDQLLTNIMLYLVTRSFGTSFWTYRGVFDEGGVSMAPDTRVELPTGIANFLDPVFPFPPRSMVERGFNVVHWTDFEKGGHFAAMETGQTFVDDVLAFVKKVRG